MNAIPLGQALSRMMGSLVLAVILGLVFLQMNDSQGTISDRQSLLFMNIMYPLSYTHTHICSSYNVGSMS